MVAQIIQRSRITANDAPSVRPVEFSRRSVDFTVCPVFVVYLDVRTAVYRIAISNSAGSSCLSCKLAWNIPAS